MNPVSKPFCEPIDRNFLNRRLSVQAVQLKLQLKQINTLCENSDKDSGDGTEDLALHETCQKHRGPIQAFILNVTNYVSSHLPYTNFNDNPTVKDGEVRVSKQHSMLLSA